MSAQSPPESVLPEDYKSQFLPEILRGKVALVTGGGSGIGFTIAEVFMRHGCDVAIASRNLEKLQAARKLLEETVPGRKCIIARMDVRKNEEVTEAVRNIVGEFGRIDILVNNAAGNFLCPAEGLSSNAFRNVIDIDTNGTFNVTKAVFNTYFKEHGGVVINISATIHINGQVLQAHAGCAKAAIEALTKHLAVEWGPLNIRLVSVSPGPIANTVGYNKLGGGQINEELIAQGIPLQRVGQRVDIAHTVIFLVSDMGSLITGTTVICDGGAVLTAINGMSRMANLLPSQL